MSNVQGKDKIYSVGEIVTQIKTGLEKQYGYVIIEGEVTNYSKHAASGHSYFALSDGMALLQCVCWKSVPMPNLTDGMKVYCSGKITAYPGRSQFQLSVMAVSVSGKGNLFKLFEEMKTRLAAEGLFDVSRKKAIPSMPRVIGVITAVDGDALQDILVRVRERVSCKVVVWSVQVQGVKAAGMIAEAIAGFNYMKARDCVAMGDVSDIGVAVRGYVDVGMGDSVDDCRRCDKSSEVRPDVIIIARGGGSMEDLWAFNEEVTVRAIAASVIPVVSAIGHEMDYTLADLVSDMRAPTPTASIEMLLPLRAEVEERVGRMGMFLEKIIQEQLGKHKQYIGMIEEMHVSMIDGLYASRAQQLDYVMDGLERTVNQRLVNMIERLPVLWDLSGAYKFYLEQFNGRQEGLKMKLMKMISDRKMRLSGYEDLMRSFSYESVLTRGFCMSSGDDGSVIMDAKEARRAGVFSVKFSDDTVRVNVDE